MEFVTAKPAEKNHIVIECDDTTQLTTAGAGVRDKRVTVGVRDELIVERTNDNLVRIRGLGTTAAPPHGVCAPPTRLEATDAVEALVAGAGGSRGRRDDGTGPGVVGGGEGEGAQGAGRASAVSRKGQA